MFSTGDPSSKCTAAPTELLESTLAAREDHASSVRAQLQTRALAENIQFRQQKTNTGALAPPVSFACAQLEEQLCYPLCGTLLAPPALEGEVRNVGLRVAWKRTLTVTMTILIEDWV